MWPRKGRAQGRQGKSLWESVYPPPYNDIVRTVFAVAEVQRQPHLAHQVVFAPHLCTMYMSCARDAI